MTQAKLLDSQLIDLASVTLEKTGWCKGSLVKLEDINKPPAHCAIGSLASAAHWAGLEICDFDDLPTNESECAYGSEDAPAQYRRVLERVAAALPKKWVLNNISIYRDDWDGEEIEVSFQFCGGEVADDVETARLSPKLSDAQLKEGIYEYLVKNHPAALIFTWNDDPPVEKRDVLEVFAKAARAAKRAGK